MTIIKKFNPEDLEKKSSKKHWIIVAFSLFILIIIQIWASNTVVAFGEKLSSISKLKYKLEIDNQILENEIADRSSLKNLATKSSELGFSKIESIQYIR